MIEIIKKLTEAYGPSGREEGIRDIIKEMIEPYADEVMVDDLGNLIVRKKGPGKKIMLAAHMDEIGLIVTFIDENGFLRFSNVGGVSPHVLLGERVRFQNGVVGTVGREKLDSIKDLKFSKLFIDIGATKEEEAREKVKIGDVAVYHRELEPLGSRVLGKSLDDRVGCSLLVKTLMELQEPVNDIYFVFTVQEEVGVRGARTAAYRIEPHYGLAVDVTRTGDTPESETMAVSLGKGPAIKIKDSLIISHPAVKKIMKEAAEKEGIPYQLEVLEKGGTDSGAIHLTREGVPSGVMSIPCRYVHTPSEMADLEDIKNGVKLLKGILNQPLS
ncbi:MAG: M42 family peptidase [Candidatus Syntrophonatronum acetioxidans]|uniref:M42 family peptidase n=1 Tax=Candidatus Syntrophonatronum acetioxidans TaxID=1795816 RepID=A0A424YHI2_9FIRM|nr:MAG: M42 family peptidase [Candidatus Syntrophonatronum acetioxidans]